jgi:hypothetical protein
MNKGTLEYSMCDGTGNYPCCTDGTCYIDNATIETNKKRWARTNQFVWDGIYNG